MRLRHAVGLTAFCLVAGSRWLIEEVWPETLPPLLGQSLHYAALSATASLFLILQKNTVRMGASRTGRTAVAGLLLFGLPFILQQFASAISAETTVALYAMVPLCIVVAVAFTRDDASRSLSMPASAGLAGVLLLLPWRPPSMAAEGVAVGVTVVGVLLTAIGSVWTHSLTCGRPFMRSVATITLANAGALALAGAIHGERFTPLARGDYAALAISLPQVFLLVWLVSEVAPERLASRFFLLPFVTLVEGTALLRPPLDGRIVAGVLLLLFGAGLLLRGEREGDVSLGLS